MDKSTIIGIITTKKYTNISARWRLCTLLTQRPCTTQDENVIYSQSPQIPAFLTPSTSASTFPSILPNISFFSSALLTPLALPTSFSTVCRGVPNGFFDGVPLFGIVGIDFEPVDSSLNSRTFELPGILEIVPTRAILGFLGLIGS